MVYRMNYYGHGYTTAWYLGKYDETQMRYIYLQTAITLYDYLRENGKVTLPPVYELRKTIDKAYSMLAEYLEKEFPQALKTDNPERQRCRSPLLLSDRKLVHDGHGHYTEVKARQGRANGPLASRK